MKAWLTRRKDPHDVYNRIFPYISNISDAIIVPRWGFHLDSRFYILRFLIAISGDAVSIYCCLRSGSRKLFVREFSGWLWQLFAPIVRFIRPSTKIYLNVNHNLNNFLERRFVLPALSRFFNIAFIEPSNLSYQSHPYLTPLYLAPRLRLHFTPVDIVYLFLGTRPEQICVSADDLAATLDQLNGKVEFIVCGGANQIRLSPAAFSKAFSAGSVIAVLYSPNAYNERHSGVVLEAIVSDCPVVMFNSPLAQTYLQRGFRIRIINGIDEILSIMNPI